MPTNSNTGKVCFAAAKVGPWDGVGSVSVITETQSFTPTLTNITASSTQAFWWRVGDRMHVSGRITLNGPATGIIGVSIPAGYTIDDNKITSTSWPIVGTVRGGSIGSAPLNVTGNAIYTGSTVINFIGANTSGRWQATEPFTWKEGDVLTFKFDVPILGWSADEGVVRIGQGVDLMGAVLPYFTNKCPAGTIEVDGSAVPSIYQAFINRTGMSTLPNAAALVPRGIGSRTINGRTKTGPSVVGEIQEDQIQGHYHSGVLYGGSGGSTPTNVLNDRIENRHPITTSAVAYANTGVGPAITDGTNGTPRTGAETRVSSFGVRWCAAVASGQQPLVKQAVIYDDVVRAEGKSGVTSIDSSLNAGITASDTTNLDSTPSVSGRYFRIGNQVELTLYLIVDPTNQASPFSFSTTMPVPSDFTAASDAVGVCVTMNNFGTIQVTASWFSDRLHFVGKQSESSSLPYTCKINYVVK